ncbi:MAG TPA: alpha/beta fold hydrolase [Ktedonobacteraceae bacterium]
MSNSASRKIGPWVGAGAAALLAGVGVVALRHALETPQPLKSVLPGEAHLYRWQRFSIFYKVLGDPDAPPLLLLHRPETGASGHEMALIMAPLAETYRVYAPDLLGFGLSDKPGVEYSAKLYNTLCQDFLREVVQRPATLLASGLSCNYAVAVAASAPELCSSLVLISPLALQGQPASRLAQCAEKPPVKALLYPLLSTRTAFRLTNRLWRKNGEDFARFYANTHQFGAEHAAMALLAGRLVQNVELLFEALQQPVLMVWGTHALESQQAVDALHRTAVLANSARQMRKVELIQQAARDVHTEQPTSVILAIKRWQAEIRQAELPLAENPPVFTLAAANQPETRAVNQAAQEFNTDAVNLAPADSLSTPDTQEIEHKPGELAGGKTAKLEIIAYCVKCKQRRPMQDAHEVIMKNGRPAMRGVCPVCGTGLNRIGGTH